MNLWWLFAIISGAGLATRNLSFKAAGGGIDPALAALILSASMTIVTIIYFVIERIVNGQAIIPATSNVPLQPFILCLVGGAGVAFANIFLALAYKEGGYASLTAILQNGFSIVVTIALGYLLLAEIIKPLQFIGILITFSGMILIAKA